MFPQNTARSLIQAAGGVVLKNIGHTLHTVIIHRPKYDDWSIPKGKVDPGETLQQTALREVQEETFLACALGVQLGSKYYPADTKLVHYWVMSVTQDYGFVPHQEVDQLRWVPLDHVTTQLHHAQDRALIHEVQTLAATRSLLTAK